MGLGLPGEHGFTHRPDLGPDAQGMARRSDTPSVIRKTALALAIMLGLSVAVPPMVTAEKGSNWQSSDWTGVVAGAPVPGTGLPGAAVPAGPADPAAGYDVGAEYEGQSVCDAVAKPGTQRLADLIKATYGGDQTVWIPRNCSIGGQSEHKEGRALDWMTSIRDAQGRANAETFLNWLLGPDAQGNPYGNATRLGVMYVMWNDRIWRNYDQKRGWTEAKGCFSSPSKGSDTVCHRDHIHISMTWDGATGNTSFWDGTPIDAKYCPRVTTGARTPEEPKGDVVGVSPVRVLDTRSGVGVRERCRLQQDRYSGDSHRIFVKVTGVGEVPGTGVSGVQVRVTALGSNAPATVRVWSPGQSSSLPVVKVGINGDAEGVATVPVSSEGTIALATTVGATDLAVDVLGYYRSGAEGPVATGASGSKDKTPQVVESTPQGTDPQVPSTPTDFEAVGSVVGYESATGAGPLQPGEERTVDLAGVPGDATSALIFITARDASKKGTLRIGRIDDSASATFAFPKKRMHKAVMLVPVSGSKVQIKASDKPMVDIRVEVLGYGKGGSTATAKALSARTFAKTKLKAGEVKTVKAAGAFGLPKKKKLRAVLLRVVTKKAAADGTVYVYATGGNAPQTRSAPVVASSKYAALVLANVGADGTVSLRSSVDAKVEATVIGFVRG